MSNNIENQIYKLKDICKIQQGFTFKSHLFKKEGLPILKITNISDGYINLHNLEYFHLEDYNKDLSKYKVNYGDVILALSGNIKIGINYTKEQFYLNYRTCKLIPNENIIINKFLFYSINNKLSKLSNLFSNGMISNLSLDDLANFEIVLPPIETQLKIVKTLDKFTELKNELKNEIDLRKNKQMKYYLNKLLSLDGLDNNEIYI